MFSLLLSVDNAVCGSAGLVPNAADGIAPGNSQDVALTQIRQHETNAKLSFLYGDCTISAYSTLYELKITVTDYNHIKIFL